MAKKKEQNIDVTTDIQDNLLVSKDSELIQ